MHGASVTAQEVINKYNQLGYNSMLQFLSLRTCHPVYDNYRIIKQLLITSHASHDKIMRVQVCQSQFSTFGTTTLL